LKIRGILERTTILRSICNKKLLLQYIHKDQDLKQKKKGSVGKRKSERTRIHIHACFYCNPWLSHL